MTKRILTYIVLFFFFAAGHASGTDLVKMQAKCEAALDKFDYESLSRQATRFLTSANRNGSKRQVGYAHFYLGVSCLYTNRGEEAFNHLTDAQRIGDELANDSLVALAMNSIAIYESTTNNNQYLAQWYFTESLKHAKKVGFNKIEGTILGNLCTILYMQEDTTGLSYARECLNFGIKHADPHLEFIGSLHLSDMLSLAGHQEIAQRHLMHAIEICKKHGYKDVGIAYVKLSNVLLDMNQTDKANYYAQKAIEEADKSVNKMVLANAYDLKARICFETGKYHESISWLKRELSCGESLQLVRSQIYELLARNHEALGNTDEALRCMTQAKQLTDSTNASDRDHMRRERDMAFNIIEQQHQIDFNKQQLRQRSIIIGGLVVLLLLLTYILWITVRNLRRRNKLYQNIVRQNQQAIERESELNTRIKELSSKDAEGREYVGKEKNGGSKVSDNKAHQIYNELCRLMEEERLYADPQLTRESIIERLGTNRTYLTEIIKEKSNGSMNYAKFINSYRIREAVRVLSDKNQMGYPIKQLCQDLGFSSVSTFHKLFKEAIGISPDAYRKSLQSL